MSGFELQRHLQQHGCWSELADARNVLLALSVANEPHDFSKLTATLRKLPALSTTKPSGSGIMISGECSEPIDFAATGYADEPDGSVRSLPLNEAVGAVSKQALIPYPPGVPLVLPGERLNRAVVLQLTELLDNGVRVHGVERQHDKPYVEAVVDE
jgi:arginine/lysine/ornithine decarboxylase